LHGILGEQIVPLITLTIIVPELVLELHLVVDNQVFVSTLKDNLFRKHLRSQIMRLSIIVPLLSKFLLLSFCLVLNVAVPGFEIEVENTSGLWCIFINP